MSEQCVQDYEFTLLLYGISDLTEEVENALFEAGCSDATLSIQYGACCLEFCRESSSLLEAIMSAISNIHLAKLKGVYVLQVDECNLVTQAEIARRIDRSRQTISYYISGKRGPGGFPPPVCHITDESPLWRWCEVSYWLAANDMIPPGEREEAEVVAAINGALEMIHQRCRNAELVNRVTERLDELCGCE